MVGNPIAEYRPAPGEHLATGWDPGTAEGDSVVHDYVSTLTKRLTRAAAVTDGRIHETADALFVDCRSDYVFDNIVVCRGPLDDASLHRTASVGSEFFDGVSGWSLLCFGHRVDLGRHGLDVIGHPPLMFRPRGGISPPRPEGLEIVSVDDLGTLGDFESTLVDAYPLPRRSAVVDPRLLRHGLRAWVGYLDGEPVATAGSFTSNGTTEIEWVSTHAAARGRGIGAALTWTALSADPTADAVLIATDDGRPVYRRLGFVPVLRLSMWMHS